MTGTGIAKADPFETKMERAAFALATGRGPKERQNPPTSDLARALRAGFTLFTWSNWVAMYHYGNLVAVVDEKSSVRPQEFDTQLASFEHEFLPINALALAQLAYLQDAQAKLATISGLSERAADDVSELESSLIRWNTRVWFDEVCQSPLGTPMYDLLARAYHLNQARSSIDRNLAQVKVHLDSLRRHTAEIRSSQSEGLLRFLTFVGLPVSVTISILSEDLKRATRVKEMSSATAWLVVGLIAGLSVAVYLVVRLRHKRGTRF